MHQIDGPNGIGFETLKLLVRVAWADHEVSGIEADYVLSLAKQSGVEQEQLESLRRDLSDEGRLPGVNLTLLRAHEKDVLQAVDQLIRIDNKIVVDERAVRSAIVRLLQHT